MENLRQDLELLYELQGYDNKIAVLKEKIDTAPAVIKAKQEEIAAKKALTEEEKKNFVNLNSLKKEKEALLASKEQSVAKHTLELNTVKSNDTYKAMLLDIEKSKADISVIEDEILELLTKIDEETVKVKKTEAELKEFEQKASAEIAEINASVKKYENEISEISSQREAHKQKVNPKILDQYERIREGRDGQGICIVEGESCGGCSMVLRPQLINMAQKCTDLVFCDNCSRILLKR